MKKFIFSIFLLLMFVSAGSMAYAAEKISTIGSSAVLYYSPANGWAKTSDAADKIKITKSSNKYSVDQKSSFVMDSDFTFIINNQLVSVNNNKLKFYTPKYENGEFTAEEMKPDELQKLFKEITVIPVSKFANGGLEVKRTPYKKEVYMLVNDTDRDFTGYSFSPAAAHATPISGIFVARRSSNIRYLTERTDRDNCLSIYVRSDYNADYDSTNADSNASVYGEYKVFEEI